MVAVFYVVLIAALAVPAAFLTAVLALLFRRSRIATFAPHTTLVLIGTIVPLLMIAYGLDLSWPWPWYQPDAMRDGIPPGPWLLVASIPSWALCILISRRLARR